MCFWGDMTCLERGCGQNIKTVKVCHSAAAQFRVHSLSGRLQNKLLWLTSSNSYLRDPNLLKSCSISPPTPLLLCRDSCTFVRPNTDDFMTWWFQTAPWLSFSSRLLRGAVRTQPSAVQTLCSPHHINADPVENWSVDHKIFNCWTLDRIGKYVAIIYCCKILICWSVNSKILVQILFQHYYE